MPRSGLRSGLRDWFIVRHDVRGGARRSRAGVLLKGPRGPLKGPRGPFKWTRGPLKGPRGPFKWPRGPLKGPRGPFKDPRGPLKGPRGPFNGPRGPVKGPRGPLKGPRLTPGLVATRPHCHLAGSREPGFVDLRSAEPVPGTCYPFLYGRVLKRGGVKRG